MHLGIFERFLQSRVMEMIFSLSLVYRARLTAVEILAQDQSFIKQLNATKHHFDRWYSFFFADA